MRTSALAGRFSTIMSATLAFMMIATAAFATHVTPSFVAGNPTCIDLTNDPDAREFRINSPSDNDTSSIGGAVTYTDPVTGFMVTIDIYQSANGPEFNFYDASIAVDSVFVKGGPNGNLYEYDPPVTADTGLHSPLNDNNNKWYGLSHISFCWVPRPSTALSLNAATPGTTVHTGTSVTLTFAETNDGNVILDNPNVTADNGCTPAYLSGDTNGNGDLDPGETWLFRCTFIPAGSVTVTATGSGITPDGKNVTYCSNPSSPPANTICDQQERVQVPITVINPSTALSLHASSSATTVHAGEPVTLVFAETNDGDVPLDAPDVDTDHPDCDPVPVSGDTNGNGDLDPGETWLFSCTINPLASMTVTATGSGIDPLGFNVTWCSNPSSPPANTVCDQDERIAVPITVINPSTALTLHASSSNTTVHSGGSVTLVFAETNDGDVTLDNPNVTANNGCTPAYQSGDTNGNGDLDPGETWLFSCTITNVTSNVTVTAIGTGVDPLGFTVTWCSNPSSPPANTICDQDERVQVPITVINPSTALSLDASSSATTIHAGDPVTLVFAETNDGNVTLDQPNVTANNGCNPAYQSGDTNGNGDLDPGETWLFACTVNPATNVTITAIGSGVDPLGFNVTWCSNPGSPPANTVCDQDERVQVPITVIHSSTTLSLDASSSSTTIPPGGSVTLVFAETNDGSAPLDAPTVTADNGCTPVYQSGDTNTNGDLDPGETWLFSCTITPASSVTVTAIGSGIDVLGFNVTWCSNPGSPPANTICDQDERVQVPITVTFEGCTPGYWKTHPESWVGYSPGQTVESVFDVPDSFGLDNDTLLTALGYQGGNGRTGAAKILLRAAVAAILNAAHPEIDYPLTAGEIVTQVNAALAGNRSAMINLASQLDGYNNAGCSL